MKNSNLSKILGASLLTLSLTSLPAIESASAQTTATPRTNVETDRSAGTDYARDDRDFDWGWLGLLGLIGLAGLARKREEPVRYRDPNEVGTTGSGTRY